MSRTDPSIARNVAVSSRPPLIIAYHWDCIMPFFFVKGSKTYIFFISSPMTDGNPHRHARFVHRTCMQWSESVALWICLRHLIVKQKSVTFLLFLIWKRTKGGGCHFTSLLEVSEGDLLLQSIEHVSHVKEFWNHFIFILFKQNLTIASWEHKIPKGWPDRSPIDPATLC